MRNRPLSLCVLAAGNSGHIFVPMMNRTHSFSLALLGLPSMKVQVIYANNIQPTQTIGINLYSRPKSDSLGKVLRSARKADRPCNSAAMSDIAIPVLPRVSTYLYFDAERGDVSTWEAIMVFESGREWQIDRPLPSSPSRQMEPFLPSSPDKTGLINGTIRTWKVKPSSPPNLYPQECDAADGRTKGGLKAIADSARKQSWLSR